MHAGTAPVVWMCHTAALFAEGACSRQPAAPALASSSTSALFQAGQQIRATLQPVHGAAVHAGGERDDAGQRGAAPQGQRLRWTTQNGEHKLLLYDT